MPPVTLTAIIRQRPAKGVRSHEGLPIDELRASAGDVEAAQADIAGRVPEGWQILSWRRTDG